MQTYPAFAGFLANTREVQSEADIPTRKNEVFSIQTRGTAIHELRRVQSHFL